MTTASTEMQKNILLQQVERLLLHVENRKYRDLIEPAKRLYQFAPGLKVESLEKAVDAFERKVIHRSNPFIAKIAEGPCRGLR